MSDAYSKQDQSETISNLEAVIYKLNEIDQKVKIFKDAVSESRGELSEFNRDKNELDNWYSATMKEIQSLLQYKLEKLSTFYQTKNNNSRTSSVLLQQEISLLRQDNISLNEKVNALKTRIYDMEQDIGSKKKK